MMDENDGDGRKWKQMNPSSNFERGFGAGAGFDITIIIYIQSGKDFSNIMI
jgi:hypothetical protein